MDCKTVQADYNYMAKQNYFAVKIDIIKQCTHTYYKEMYRHKPVFTDYKEIQKQIMK